MDMNEEEDGKEEGEEEDGERGEVRPHAQSK